MRKLCTEAVDLIKQFEGCKLTAYKDIVGVYTVGYGATGSDVKEGVTLTQAQADERLLSDLRRFLEGVLKLAEKPLTDNQLGALVSFAFNLGLGGLKKSTLLKYVNAGRFDLAAPQFLQWDNAGGKKVAGLTRRRQAEKDLFEKASTTHGCGG